jgi:hypothetical protein
VGTAKLTVVFIAVRTTSLTLQEALSSADELRHRFPPSARQPLTLLHHLGNEFAAVIRLFRNSVHNMSETIKRHA